MPDLFDIFRYFLIFALTGISFLLGYLYGKADSLEKTIRKLDNYQVLKKVGDQHGKKVKTWKRG